MEPSASVTEVANFEAAAAELDEIAEAAAAAVV